MDTISQLQDQANKIAELAFNTFGSLQRDAPLVRLSVNYTEPPSSAAAVVSGAEDEAAKIAEESKNRSAELVKAAKKFDVLVAALPCDDVGEEAQLRRIEELQAENDVAGLELQRQLEAAEKELRQIQELYGHAADSCLNLKKPDEYPQS